MSYDILRVLQNFQSKRGVNLEKGGFPIGTIRPFDGVNFRKIADTGGKADWIRVDTPHGDKVHMDINKFNQFLSMLSFGDEDFEKRYLKKRSDFITNLGKIYHPNDVEVLLEKTKNPAAKVKPVHGRVFLEDSEGKPIIPDHIKGHLQATGLKVVSSEQKKIISKDDLSAENMLHHPQTKKILGDYGFDKDWTDRMLAKPSNYKPGIYYRIESGTGAGIAGVGEGLYLGKDKIALRNFYGHEQEDGEVKISTYKDKGTLKVKNLLDYEDYQEFEKIAKKIFGEDKDALKKLTLKEGYDGIKYYDPAATGEEFVIYKTDSLEKVDKSYKSDKNNLSADEKYSENIGRKLGAGTFNSAFNYNKDENKVVKFGEQIFHHAKIFSQYPKYFPIVYGINKEDESILIEKLDVNSAEEDLVNEILNNKVYKEIANKDSLGYVDIKTLKSQNKFNLIKDHLSKKGQFLFSSLYEIYHNTPMRDFKLVNFGYNKEGKLKGLDL